MPRSRRSSRSDSRGDSARGAETSSSSPGGGFRRGVGTGGPADDDALITDQAEFDDFCQRARDARLVAFDTEFVSESTFRPELCLMQFSAAGETVGVDPFELTDLTPWWDLMTDDRTTVIVHGGQAEVKFCLEATGQAPRRLVDVQLAEGLRSTSYPLGYDALVQRVLNVRAPKGSQTRTDWRRRPLSADQLSYALRDAEFLPKIWEIQRKDLQERGRTAWAAAEFVRFVRSLAEDHRREPHERLSGLSKLSRRDLAVAREVAIWRQAEAEEKNRPVRRILRDDLVIDIAKRQPETEEQLLAPRDMNRGDIRRSAEDLLAAIERGKAVSDDDLPERVRREGPDKNPDEHVLGQLLGIALSSLCNEHEVARTIAGTAKDLRELVRWHTAGRPEGVEVPLLATGWRKELCGQLLTDLLDGEIAMRVADAKGDHPLSFERG
ncbi:ribonuclease D [Alienimonas californiensis]|uniref:Ribonuclease D n=1 Tax=Alienimonas californiensis TaxID=2527989 RepID=A0A517PA89_9PLAN|nr:HRDC domain-containing protein [Alienimonas californiensis]QDT16291.1 Ribonuclease D [Alienimonas californiensis]